MTGRMCLHDFSSFYFIRSGFAIDPMHEIFGHDCRWVWLKVDGLRQVDEGDGRTDVGDVLFDFSCVGWILVQLLK